MQCIDYTSDAKVWPLPASCTRGLMSQSHMAPIPAELMLISGCTRHIWARRPTRSATSEPGGRRGQTTFARSQISADMIHRYYDMWICTLIQLWQLASLFSSGNGGWCHVWVVSFNAKQLAPQALLVSAAAVALNNRSVRYLWRILACNTKTCLEKLSVSVYWFYSRDHNRHEPEGFLPHWRGYPRQHWRSNSYHH